MEGSNGSGVHLHIPFADMKSGADDSVDDSSLLNQSVEPNDSKHVSSQKVLDDQGELI